MEKKLTIEHLASYLPYDLKIMYKGFIVGMASIHKNSDFSIETSPKIRGKKYLFNKDFKPILRPLSDLTEEIEVNGKKFVPMDILDKRNNMELHDWFKEFDRQELVNCLPYWVVEFMLKWNFDVFGLIKDGLAIDINTLTND